MCKCRTAENLTGESVAWTKCQQKINNRLNLFDSVLLSCIIKNFHNTIEIVKKLFVKQLIQLHFSHGELFLMFSNPFSINL